MRTTITIDDELLARAHELTGTVERSALIRQALEALVARESARRLARLGGTDPDAEAASRSRQTRTTHAAGRLEGASARASRSS